MSRRGRRRVIARLVEAANASRYDDLEQVVSADFTYLDTMSNPIEGGRRFVIASRLLREAVPDLMIRIDEITECSGVLLVRGRMVSKIPEFCSDSLWSVRCEGGKIVEIQAFRDNNAISLPSYSRLARSA